MTHLLRVTVLLCMLFFGMTGLAFSQTAPAAGSYETTLLPGEQWWGGLSHDAGKMPYTSQTRLARDMWGNNDENQAQPLLISSRGRYVWCNDPIKYTFNAGKLTVSSRTGAVQHGQAGNDLASAYRYASKTFFPPNGQLPDPAMFALPQYNTWIKLKYK